MPLYGHCNAGVGRIHNIFAVSVRSYPFIQQETDNNIQGLFIPVIAILCTEGEVFRPIIKGLPGTAAVPFPAGHAHILRMFNRHLV